MSKAARVTDHTDSPRQRTLVLVLCGAVLALEGYDIVVFGAAVPVLVRTSGWDLSRADVGVLGSVALVGMLLGALTAGFWADRRGRRPVLLTGLVMVSAGMLLCGAAPTAAVFGAGRLVVGLGAGVLLPTAAALVSEYAPTQHRNLYQGLAFSGIGYGGLCSALAALTLGGQGFRGLFLLGALPAVVLLPALLRWLPESADYLATRRDRTAHRKSPPDSWRLLFARDHAATTVAFLTVTFLSLLVLFGAYTWLPVLMTRAGYSLGTSLGFLVVLNLGVIVGSATSPRLADRFGARPAILLSYTAGAVALVLLAQAPPVPVGYGLTALVGAGLVTAQFLVNALIAASYPTLLRGKALGLALGIGRFGGVLGPLYGGWLLTDGFAAQAGFYGFAVPGLLAGLLAGLAPRGKAVAAGQGGRRPGRQPTT
ncbi:MFS transporter [Actinoplanes sp. ATCC 53533]|uniref:MFS transporter n=1 Tax=Actinoplanes sp. ATCC 53533 TaxID=1288362 RepID=UPI00131576E0|nr:MFS transporter [Actinoplanes sp. ATCC 53533]